MTYAVKEIFYTLQGEGAQAGRASVFCRFAGCNLWSGREEDRARAVCNFCDTDFVGTDGQGGGKFATAEALADAIASRWPADRPGRPYVVCTGGEPLLQVDTPLIEALHARGFEIAVETNGTQPAPEGLDWICVSPKADAELVLTRGHELKLVYPQPLARPERFAGLDFQHFFLQPLDSVLKTQHIREVVDYCMQHPQWRMSVQMHKVIGIE
ncbi:7-carboxy-7-deazaguanine synthase [Paucibacter sp. DJ2R-2]|uniref:7-carboxy-7-deazaguanine synthase n=1 Tax=Paucibacter sp. DJ2R-2 TaxID=2893558 RepID=UPI0021E435FB|nr:7-carboxy-7-deazaguanine synthase [Paucibacter sp. DJ2R-2]MCV2419168.1 7-carboxy-7-deazaguanine synthase [Paucibacter sp. DJ4R-1]MCV2437877.1 7-carboxy-7-deazaguanine synthase [Paucibacter sp. DJ2R-2]